MRIDDEQARAVSKSRAALAAVAGDPGMGRELARSALSGARACGSREAESIAEQALGLGARFEGFAPKAIHHLNRAIRIAEKANLQTQAALSSVSLAPALQMAGRTSRAIDVLRHAAEKLQGLDRARALTQLGGVYKISGELDSALACLRQALPVLRSNGDQAWEARALGFRAEIRVEQGRFRSADIDYQHAAELAALAGNPLLVAGMLHNRGWSAAYAGDVPAALEHYETADERFRAMGISLAELELDRADVLLFAGLAGEALAIADSSARALQSAGEMRSYPNALLTAAHAALATGDSETARRRAEEARVAFRRQQRAGWTALASYASVRARWTAGDHSQAAMRSAQKAGKDLAKATLATRSMDARLVAGRIALAIGRTSIARTELGAVSAARRRGTAEQRSRGWLAEALLRINDGQRISAFRALRAGLDIIDRHRATMGATELRAHASNHATDLATIGQRLAIESGRPESVLEWTERWRGAALRLPAVRPPDDRELAADLAALREAHTDFEKAAADGEPTGAIGRRRSALEDSVLRRTRRTAGSGGDAEAIAKPSELSAALRDSALVEIAAVDDRIFGVTLVDGRLRLHQLGDVPTVVAELDSVRFSLRRLAFAHGGATSLAAAMFAVSHSGTRLDDLLLAPMLGEIGDRQLVLVPPAGLHTLPWSTLPSCAKRDVTIAPSATTWLRCAQSRPPRGKRVVVAAGPGLPGADVEVAAIGRLHDTATVLAGRNATATAVSKAIDGAGLAHIAAHGTFRGDNPLFSSLTLADGPLTVYDFERLRRAPYRVVLSSCDSGLAGVRAGDELMGLAAALFPLGTAGIVASVVPVPDHATYPLMLALHERLVAGEPLSLALANARSTLDPDDAVQFAAGAAFIALGAH